MKVLLVSKHSRYEWEKKRLGQTEQDLHNKYQTSHLQKIKSSHEHQLAVREELCTHLEVFDSCHVMLDDLELGRHRADIYDLVIVLGGDNAFTLTSHFIKNNKILGINSDPKLSIGCLTQYAIHNPKRDTINLVAKLRENRFCIQNWTRVSASINGEETVPVTSECFIGEYSRDQMSRHILTYNNVEYEQKGSGLILATGAGSTGWFRSASKPGIIPWAPTANYYALTLTEPFSTGNTDLWPAPYNNHKLTASDMLEVISLNDKRGILSIDSWKKYDLAYRDVISFGIGNPLKVVVPK